MENDYLDMGLYQSLAAFVSEAITENNLEFIRYITDVNNHPQLDLERLITMPTKDGFTIEEQVHSLPDSEYKIQIMEILGIEEISIKGGRRRRRTRSKLRKLKSRNSKRRRYRK
jgi:hypothetical protein